MFISRDDAGMRLAEVLALRAYDDPVVYALPRGGLPVAAPIAARLNAPLDLILVRKLGAPGQPEFAIGAVVDGETPVTVLHRREIDLLGIGDDDIERTEQAALTEIARRRKLYLAGRQPVPAAGRTAIVVDDGIATGATVEAALQAIRARKPARVILAVPVAAPDTLARLAKLADGIVCLETPERFMAVGMHYEEFPQIGDDEVRAILEAAWHREANTRDLSSGRF